MLHLISQLPKMTEIMLDAGKALLEDQQLKKLMESESFDLIVINFVMTDYFVGLGEHFDCPVIMISAAVLTTHTTRLLGNPLDVSAAKHFYLSKTENMNFWVRLGNFMLTGIDLVVLKYFEAKVENVYK